MYVEDWYATGELTGKERQQLAEQVFCRYLPGREEYVRGVEGAGLEVVEVAELTEGWKGWVEKRRDRWVEGKEQWVGVHGEELYERLLSFYQLIVDLMQGGHIGGIRIAARKAAA